MAENATNNLPSTIQGDGSKFISLLKKYLKDIASELDTQIKKVERIFNATADNPDTFPEQVYGITIEEKNEQGSVSLLVKWNSDRIKQYAGVGIDVKVGDFSTTTEQFEKIEWTRHYDTTKTNSYMIQSLAVGKKYLIRLRARNIVNAISEEKTAPTKTYYISETNHTPNGAYQFTVVFDKRGAYWSWKQYDQNDYEWSELRLDTNVGSLQNRLEITTGLSSTAVPTARSGTAYLYNKGISNSWSVPATLQYNKPVPHAPRNIIIEKFYEGLKVTFDSIPEDCNGATIYVNNEPYPVTSNVFTFNCSTGLYKIKICYTDIFGEGEMSAEVSESTVEQIPSDAIHITKKTVFDDGVIVAKYIGDKAVVGTKIQDGAISTDKIAANAITGNKIAANAITGDKIKAGEIQSQHIKTNSITGDKITTNTLDGRAIKTGTLTGDRIAANTISGDNIKARSITGDNIESKTITSDKLVVNELAAISGKLGKVESGEVVASSIHSADNSFSIDKSGNIRGANLTGVTISGSRIDADSMYQAGFHMRNVDIIVRDYNHGDTIYLPQGYSWENCVAIPQGIVDYVNPQNGNSWFGSRVFNALPRGEPIMTGITIDHSVYAYRDHYYNGDTNDGWGRTPYKVRVILILFQK